MAAVAAPTKKPLWQILLIVAVNLLLVALIIALTIANWMPAIYQSEWFKSRFGS